MADDDQISFPIGNVLDLVYVINGKEGTSDRLSYASWNVEFLYL